MEEDQWAGRLLWSGFVADQGLQRDSGGIPPLPTSVLTPPAAGTYSKQALQEVSEITAVDVRLRVL